MLKHIGSAVLVLFGAAAPAIAVEALETQFQVQFSYADEAWALESATAPLLPDNACYAWFIRTDAAEDGPALNVVERFKLPAPPADWLGLDSESGDGVEISDDGTLATSNLSITPEPDGWIKNSWCVAEGDPVGHHHFEVSIEGGEAIGFDFDAVLPEDYAWPAIRQPVPRERSVDKSW